MQRNSDHRLNTKPPVAAGRVTRIVTKLAENRPSHAHGVARLDG
jgi:hypothetical protein